ncbi:uncharacterized protein DNG_08387 [Cephalotrichum gorgonifer]|uniref:BTB domain-containing protein n=1 Tax=Cephalotrichum gorgonifer TaxID=2041049 RepID=A0AAE8SYB0_9PEZI|nr:uncharacterized protein DNG_08387 [Cephalotrichum gorgonifer]
MVSKQDFSSSLAVRGPSSLVSRHTYSHSQSHTSSQSRSQSRSKRYNRSHAGGASYIPQNEFPVFSNSGDVEILVKAGGHENRYLLHRHTLTRCSGFFEASTSLEWSRAGGRGDSSAPEEPPPSTVDLARIGGSDEPTLASGDRLAGGRRRWRYELDSGTDDGDIPMLIQKDPDDTGGGSGGAVSLFGGPVSGSKGNGGAQATNKPPSSAPTHSNRSFFRSVANLSLVPSSGPPSQPLSQADQDLLRNYDNLLRIFYNYPPIMDGVNIADAYVQCKALLTLADQYDSLAVVGPRVDHHLLQFQSRLWRQIAKYPISYLRLGYLSRSKIIFQEALIHVVGQWPAGERSLRGSLPEDVLEMIEDKVDELEENVSRVESRLFRLNLCTPRGERVTPATSYLDWLAVSLFRQWLADNTTPTPPPPHDASADGADGGAKPPPPPSIPPLASLGRAFRTMGDPHPGSYLTHDECKRFMKLTPELYSRDNLRRFEKRLDELKGMAREIVAPLMGSGLELEFGRGVEGLGYLTCTTVRDRDLPW